MIRRLSLVVLVALSVAIGVRPAVAQTTVNQTTLSAAVDGVQSTVSVASAATLAVNQLLFIDKEADRITAINGTVISVQRGYASTNATAHVSGAIVYSGAQSSTAGGVFWASDPQVGSCTYSSEQYSLRIVPSSGRIWSCSNGQWTNVVDSYVFVPFSSCNSAVSANSTGTNGFTTLGTGVPVVQAQTSSTATHYFDCSIPVPTRSNVLTSAYIVDAEFYYGTQTTALGTQAAVLASGTMNGNVVFSKSTYPVPGASETALDATVKTRADSGSLLITPAVGSFNVALTASGSFFSVKFTPASPIAMSTNRTQYWLNVSLLGTTSQATIVNSPGFVVHYRLLAIGI